MSDLPQTVYLAEQIRQLDQATMQDAGISGYELMCRAGEAAYGDLQTRWSDAGRLAVFCGKGNNGGDGYVLARLAQADGWAVQVWSMASVDTLSGDVALAARDYRDSGGRLEVFDGRGPSVGEVDVVVDALFGTGLQRAVKGRWAEAITTINQTGSPVMAIDLPSGLNADTGAVMGVAVRADLTTTFIGLKPGLLTGDGPDYRGDLRFHSLGASRNVYAGQRSFASRVTQADLVSVLRPRPRTAHKGHHGHVLIIGGAPGMSGAARMAAQAALRVGAGLASVATHPSHAATLNATRPELMVHGVTDAAGLAKVLARASVTVLGPGLGRDAWAEALFRTVNDCDLPLVVDADGLNILAERGGRSDRWLLTPHPGEAGRLLGLSVAEVQADRFTAARVLSARYGGVVVLKGPGTVITDGSRVALCDVGNPGMASGGMGDVLSGVIGGLLAQGVGLFDAGALGAFVHGRAGDLAADGQERGLLAMDLMPWLRRVVNS